MLTRLATVSSLVLAVSIVAAHAAKEQESEFSLEVWLQPVKSGIILSQNHDFQFSCNDNGYTLLLRGESQDMEISVEYPMTLGATHLVFSRSADGSINAFLNGRPVKISASAVTKSAYTGNAWEGQMYMHEIRTKAVSASEAKDLYQGGWKHVNPEYFNERNKCGHTENAVALFSNEAQGNK